MIKNLLHQLRHRLSADETSDAVKPGAGSVTRLSADKIKAVINDLVGAEPIFNDAGFIMDELDIEVGIVPKLTPKFRHFKEITLAQESEILDRLNERKLIKFLLISLFKSSRIKKMLEGSEMNLHVIEIDITAIPSVRATFRRAQAQGKSEEPSIEEVTRH